MGDFDIRSLRMLGFFILIALIFLVFLGLASNAYKNLPERTSNVVEETVINDDENFESNADDEESVEEIVDEEFEEQKNQEDIEYELRKQEAYERRMKEREEHLRREQQRRKKMAERESLKPLEKISEENPSIESDLNNKKELSEQDKLNKLLEDAITNQLEGNYEKSNELLFNLIDSANDFNVEVDCYDQIVKNYISLKDLPTALEYAQRAYDLMPTKEREAILLNLNDKLGNIELYKEVTEDEVQN